MNDFLKQVEKKINKSLNPEKISLIDNSYLHKGHKSFDAEKFHIKLTIESKKLKTMNKLAAHKLIFSILKEEVSTKIHALEIIIK